MLNYAVLLCLWLVRPSAGAAYLPGSEDVAYARGMLIPIHVDQVASSKTQVPYSYYSLDFCRPATLESEKENLGQILSGHLIQNTPYEVKMQQEDVCHVLCSKTLTKASIDGFKAAIDDEYFVTLLADGLPAALRVRGGLPSDDGTLLVSGYPVGVNEKVKSGKGGSTAEYLINHVDMLVRYHETPSGSRVVGFEITPRSIDHVGTNASEGKCTLEGKPMSMEHMSPGQSVVYSYSVSFAPSETSWATRWDAYINAAMEDPQIHWVSIINAFVVVVMLSSIVGAIFLRTVMRSISQYNAEDIDIEGAQDETGWKIVHGDVFRRPNFSKLLATCVGTGVQVTFMLGLTLLFALLGFLSPQRRGSLLQAMLVLFALMGIPAGYTSARLNKLFQGEETNRSLVVLAWTCFQYTGVCFVVFLTINSILWFKSSSAAVPFKSLCIMMALWFGLSAPMVFVGSVLGYRRAIISLPVRTNNIPRPIPKAPFLMHPVISSLAAGILPFGACFTEASFIMASVWQHRFYYLFGFLALVVLILIVTCAETSVVFTYLQLAREDHRWWWRSYWASASSAVYFMLFCIMYFFRRMEIVRFGSVILYFGYSFVMAYTVFLVTGTAGFLASFWFLRLIYGYIKVD